jgi:hypothetical protein
MSSKFRKRNKRVLDNASTYWDLCKVDPETWREVKYFRKSKRARSLDRLTKLSQKLGLYD